MPSGCSLGWLQCSTTIPLTSQVLRRPRLSCWRACHGLREGLVPSDDIRVKLTYKDAGERRAGNRRGSFQGRRKEPRLLARPMHEGAYVVPERSEYAIDSTATWPYTYSRMEILLRRVIDNFVNGGKTSAGPKPQHGRQGPSRYSRQINPQIALVKGR